METIINGPCPSTRVRHQFRDSIWLITVMVGVLQQHFGNAERVCMETSKFLWDRETANTKLTIDNADNLNFDQGEVFPKLVVDIENQGFPRDSLGDLEGVGSGGRDYTIRNVSAYSIEAWGLQKLELLSLCDEVRLFVQTFRHNIACTYGFNTLRPAQLIKPVRSQIHTNYWVARLIVEFEINDNWGVSLESLREAAVRLNLKVL